jgi:uncharacterized membrane protein (DUF485 family)
MLTLSVVSDTSQPPSPSTVSLNRSEAPLAPDWSEVAASPAFTRLLAVKRRIIGSMLLFSVGFFLVLTLLCGFARSLMNEDVVGPLGLGYVLIIALYGICWLMAITYVYVAENIFDTKAGEVSVELRKKGVK